MTSDVSVRSSDLNCTKLKTVHILEGVYQASGGSALDYGCAVFRGRAALMWLLCLQKAPAQFKSVKQVSKIADEFL